jgi:hypothetical protein
VPFIFWLQDIYAEAIARIVGSKLGPLAWPVIWHYRRLETRLLREAASVVAITDDFKPLLASGASRPTASPRSRTGRRSMSSRRARATTPLRPSMASAARRCSSTPGRSA